MMWQRALDQVIRDYIGQPLAWGVRDCCQFAADYVELLTGVDHAKAFGYRNQAGALTILKTFGGIEPLIESEIGPSHRKPAPGDLVICAVEDFETVGVTNGSFVWCVHPTNGLCRTTIGSIRCAWSP